MRGGVGDSQEMINRDQRVPETAGNPVKEKTAGLAGGGW
jgi:hypothetical protein